MPYPVYIRNSVGGINNSSSQVFTDWAGSKIYAWDGPHAKLLRNSMVDGTVQASNPAASVFPISSNTSLADRSTVLINGFLVGNSSGSANKLSKIDVTTLTEVAAITPTLFASPEFAIDGFNYVAFTVGGNDYVIGALYYSASNPNIEVFSVTPLASVATGHYPHGNDAIFLVPGGVSGTVATFWMWNWESENSPYLVRVQFDTSGNTLSFSTIGSAADPTAINSDATGFHDVGMLVYETADASVIASFSLDVNFGQSPLSYCAKYDTATGDLVWFKALSQAGMDSYDAVMAAVNPITDGKYRYWDNFSTYREFDTSDGSEVGSYSYSWWQKGFCEYGWNASAGLFVFYAFAFNYTTGSATPVGWTIWEPSTAVPERWDPILDGGEAFYAVYRDPLATDPVYVLQETVGGEGLPNWGYELVKRDPTDGSIIAIGATWGFEDPASPLNMALPFGIEAEENGNNIASAPGIGKGYFSVAVQVDDNNFQAAIIEVDLTSLTVTQTKLTQASGKNNLGNSGGVSGNPDRGVNVTCVLSPDGVYFVGSLDISTNGGAGIVWQALQVWCPASGQYSYTYLDSIGIAVTDRVSAFALLFDKDNFLYLLSQPVAGGTQQPITGTSTLWKLSLSGGVMTPPVLAVVDSYSVPDNFYSLVTADFADSFSYSGFSYNSLTHKLYLWSSAHIVSLGNFNPYWCMEFDIAGETFSAALEPAKNYTRYTSWNNDDIYGDFNAVSGSGYGLLITNTATMTSAYTLNQDEWKFYNGGLPDNVAHFFYASANGAWYVQNANLTSDGASSWVDLMLLSASSTFDEMVDETATAADAPAASLTISGAIAETAAATDSQSGNLTYDDTVDEAGDAQDAVSTPRPGPLWMTIGGESQDSIFPN